MEKLNKIKETLASLDEKLKKAKADMGENDKYSYMFEYLYEMTVATRRYMYELEEALYTHASPSNGHLPKIKGAGKMQKCLKTLGMEDDYEVEKPAIYVSASKNGVKEINVNLNIPKK